MYWPEHPKVAIYASNMGQILKDKGDLEWAQKQIERALKIFENHYGLNNPQTRIVRDNLDGIIRAKSVQ